MDHLLNRIDGVLRDSPRARLGTVGLILLLLACAPLYGAAMGSYGGIGGDRIWQVVFSAIKVPILLATVFALSGPSFLVLNWLLGLGDDIGRALRALLTAQAVWLVILVSLIPYTMLWYVSGPSYNAAVLFNAAMFALASMGAQYALRRAYRPLIQSDRRHLWMLRIWLVLFAFIGIQMGWMLRPFIGAPSRPVEFFRAESTQNAYLIVAMRIWGELRDLVGLP